MEPTGPLNKPDYHVRTYHISFDTKSKPPYIVSVCIQVSNDLIYATETANLALCEDPLYPALEQYVLDNPTKRSES